MDAMGKLAFKPYTPKQKAEFKKMKVEEELSSTLADPQKTRVLANKFEAKIAADRKAAWL